MVKTLVQIIIGVVRLIAAWPALRSVFELVAIVLLAIAFGMWWGAPAVLVVLAVAFAVKSAEMDLRSGGRSGGA